MNSGSPGAFGELSSPDRLGEQQELFDREMRVQIIYPEARKEVIETPGGGTLVRFIRPAPGMNFISYVRAPEDELDALIEAQVEYLLPLGQPFEWNVYDHDTPPSLKQKLEAHGFACDGKSPILALDLEAAPPALLEPVRADVREISTREGLETVIAVLERVYNRSFAWMRARLGGHLEIPGFLKLYAAWADGQPVCAGWIYFYPNSVFAGLWGGATVPHFRRRGLYTALLAARVQEAIHLKRRYIFLDASDMSRPIAQKHGFRLLDWACSYEYGEG